MEKNVILNVIQIVKNAIDKENALPALIIIIGVLNVKINA